MRIYIYMGTGTAGLSTLTIIAVIARMVKEITACLQANFIFTARS